MKYVYVVSPDYLEAMYEQSIPFSFDIKGFCSIEQGIKNLGRTNISEIIGFAIVLHSLPTELAPLIQLINKINLISSGHTVVLCLYFKEGFDILENYLDIYNIDLFLYTGFQDVTDAGLRRGIYGTIIKNTSEPYNYNTDLKEMENLVGPQIQHYDPIFNEKINLLVEPIVSATDIRRATQNDTILQSYDDDTDQMFRFLRGEKINKKYKNDFDSSELFNRLLKEENDISKRLLFSSLYKLIQEGKI